MMTEKELKDRKGELSRLIGAAKKANEPIDNLLSEMKQVSAQLKSLESSRKEKNKASSASKKAEVCLPQLFSERDNSAEPLSEVRLAVEADKEKWNEFVKRNSGSSIYHCWEFKSLIEKTFGHATHYFVALTDEGNICGVLPSAELKSSLFGHFIVSLPFFNYGAPLSSSLETEERLVSALIEHARKLGIEHIEIRSTYSRKGLLEKQSKVAMVRALPSSVDELWNDIGTKVRAQIKKADRYHLQCRIGGAELLDDYYKVFSINMRDLGTPVYSKVLFDNLFKLSINKQFNVVVVYDGEKAVSAGFLMGHKDTLEIPWASTLKEANSKNANMFMYWKILSFAIERGYSFFDFGRSSADAGTYRFKKQWGAEPKQLYWHYWLANGDDLPELNPNNPKYRFLIAVWQRLPVWLTKLIGPPVVKFLP